MVVQDEKPNEKPTSEEYLANESDLLRGLLDAVQEKEDETATIEVARRGKVYFRFRVRPLNEEEYEACREKATTYKRNRQFGGLKLPEDTNTTRYRSLLIYTATVAEDRKRLWDNKKAWQECNVLSGPDLIDVVLKAGEKDAIIQKLDELSGFGEVEEMAKN